MSCPLFLLVAGGTGGHLFPAQALAMELASRGYRTHLLTDLRGGKYMEDFSGDWSIVPSSPLSFRSPVQLFVGLCRIIHGVVLSLLLFLRLRPVAVVAFGGYPSVPPLVAAWILRIPICLHEQNSIVGRANRLFLGRARCIALSFEGMALPSDAAGTLAVHTGNPVRQVVLAARTRSYEPHDPKDVFRILIFGGSQGARIFSEVVPGALSMLDPAVRAGLHIVQQVRQEDFQRVEKALKDMGVAYDIAPFFPDIPYRMTRSHLVICRAGATTVAELTTLGCPAILVPFAQSVEGDQLSNARILENAGAAWCVQQKDFTAAWLGEWLSRFIKDPEALLRTAQAARSLGTPLAAQRLADLLISVADIHRRKECDARQESSYS